MKKLYCIHLSKEVSFKIHKEKRKIINASTGGGGGHFTILICLYSSFWQKGLSSLVYICYHQDNCILKTDQEWSSKGVIMWLDSGNGNSWNKKQNKKNIPETAIHKRNVSF